MPKSPVKTLTCFNQDEVCQFCRSNIVSEVTLGPIYKKSDVIVHYYCLLMAACLEQNGTDSQGLLGFLVKDIKKAVFAGSNKKCSYCKKYGATVICSNKRCNKRFHLPCGQAEGSLHQFFNNFKSFCGLHRPKQKIPGEIKKAANNVCVVCFNSIDIEDLNSTLWPPCCQSAAFIHRECVQRMATSAGYYFKCPLCNNTKEFQQAMSVHGIYIPEQEAIWEREPNAYRELLARHDICDAQVCLCSRGRTYSKKNSDWQIELCIGCGGSGTHLKCCIKWNPSKGFKFNWICLICSPVVSSFDEEGAAASPLPTKKNQNSVHSSKLLSPEKKEASDASISSSSSSASAVIVISDSDANLSEDSDLEVLPPHNTAIPTLRKRKFRKQGHILPSKRAKHSSSELQGRNEPQSVDTMNNREVKTMSLLRSVLLEGTPTNSRQTDGWTNSLNNEDDIMSDDIPRRHSNSSTSEICQTGPTSVELLSGDQKSVLAHSSGRSVPVLNDIPQQCETSLCSIPDDRPNSLSPNPSLMDETGSPPVRLPREFSPPLNAYDDLDCDSGSKGVTENSGIVSFPRGSKTPEEKPEVTLNNYSLIDEAPGVPYANTNKKQDDFVQAHHSRTTINDGDEEGNPRVTDNNSMENGESSSPDDNSSDSNTYDSNSEVDDSVDRCFGHCHNAGSNNSIKMLVNIIGGEVIKLAEDTSARKKKPGIPNCLFEALRNWDLLSQVLVKKSNEDQMKLVMPGESSESLLTRKQVKPENSESPAVNNFFDNLQRLELAEETVIAKMKHAMPDYFSDVLQRVKRVNWNNYDRIIVEKLRTDMPGPSYNSSERSILLNEQDRLSALRKQINSFKVDIKSVIQSLYFKIYKMDLRNIMDPIENGRWVKEVLKPTEENSNEWYRFEINFRSRIENRFHLSDNESDSPEFCSLNHHDQDHKVQCQSRSWPNCNVCSYCHFKILETAHGMEKPILMNSVVNITPLDDDLHRSREEPNESCNADISVSSDIANNATEPTTSESNITSQDETDIPEIMNSKDDNPVLSNCGSEPLDEQDINEITSDNPSGNCEKERTRAYPDGDCSEDSQASDFKGFDLVSDFDFSSGIKILRTLVDGLSSPRLPNNSNRRRPGRPPKKRRKNANQTATSNGKTRKISTKTVARKNNRKNVTIGPRTVILSEGVPPGLVKNCRVVLNRLTAAELSKYGITLPSINRSATNAERCSNEASSSADLSNAPSTSAIHSEDSCVVSSGPNILDLYNRPGCSFDLRTTEVVDTDCDKLEATNSKILENDPSDELNPFQKREYKSCSYIDPNYKIPLRSCVSANSSVMKLYSNEYISSSDNSSESELLKYHGNLNTLFGFHISMKPFTNKKFCRCPESTPKVSPKPWHCDSDKYLNRKYYAMHKYLNILLAGRHCFIYSNQKNNYVKFLLKNFLKERNLQIVYRQGFSIRDHLEIVHSLYEKGEFRNSVVFIITSVNNYFCGEDHFDMLLDLLKRMPETRIVLSTSHLRKETDSESINDAIYSFNETLMNICSENHIPCLDINRKMLILNS